MHRQLAATLVAATLIQPQPASFGWSADRRLNWSDFRGQPQPGSRAAAMTAYRMTFESECNGNTFTFRVESLFLPGSSWVSNRLLLQSADDYALRHEQTHFDLSEVNARRLRRALLELADPCVKTSDERLAIARRFVQEDSDVQRRYDFETTHGVDLIEQGRWTDDVAKQLRALGQYAR